MLFHEQGEPYPVGSYEVRGRIAVDTSRSPDSFVGPAEQNPDVLPDLGFETGGSYQMLNSKNEIVEFSYDDITHEQPYRDSEGGIVCEVIKIYTGYDVEKNRETYLTVYLTENNINLIKSAVLSKAPIKILELEKPAVVAKKETQVSLNKRLSKLINP